MNDGKNSYKLDFFQKEEEDLGSIAKEETPYSQEVISKRKVKQFFAIGIIIGFGLLFIILPFLDINSTFLEKIGLFIITVTITTAIGFLKEK